MYARSIPRSVFAARRKLLMERMGAHSIALLPAAPVRQRNRDTEYPYRPDSDFYYVTGFPEPEALAALIPGAEHEFLLFCRDRDPVLETWQGRRAGPQGAMENYGAAQAYPCSALEKVLLPLLENKERVYYPLGECAEFDQQVLGWVKRIRSKVRTGVRAPDTFIALAALLHPLRLRKQPEEIAVMREAGRIAAAGHVRAMQRCQPGMMEYQVEAEMFHTLLAHGCTWSYPPIVAGGAHACILHYTENNAELRAGDLLLIDAGAELDGYASDITRTFPVNGRFSGAQREIYQLVLAAQQAAIAQVRPGRHCHEPHQAAVRVLVEGLVALGLLPGAVAEIIESERYKTFYMHSTGHWLGMDVHDVGAYKDGAEWQVFEAGMVTTIEPGLYLPATTRCWDAQWQRLGVDLEVELAPQWHNIGVRIEDDVLVTEEEPEVLTSAVPKAVDEIEALMRG